MKIKDLPKDLIQLISLYVKMSDLDFFLNSVPKYKIYFIENAKTIDRYITCRYIKCPSWPILLDHITSQGSIVLTEHYLKRLGISLVIHTTIVALEKDQFHLAQYLIENYPSCNSYYRFLKLAVRKQHYPLTELLLKRVKVRTNSYFRYTHFLDLENIQKLLTIETSPEIEILLKERFTQYIQ